MDGVKNPLLTMQLIILLSNVLIHVMKDARNGKISRDLKRKSDLRDMTAFSKSMAAIMPLHPFVSTKSMTALIVLMPTKIVRPFTNAYWLRCIIYGRTFSNLFAITFEPIVTSTLVFTREIGLQSFISLLPISFFVLRL